MGMGEIVKGLGDDSEMIVEVNGKKFEYDNRSGWENKVGERIGKNSIDVVAYKENPDVFFQVFKENKGFNLQKRAITYSLEFGLDEMDQSKIVELVDLYFNDDYKFDSYFKWDRVDSGLTKEEQKEYKKTSSQKDMIWQIASLALFLGSILFINKLSEDKFQNFFYRLVPSIGLSMASFGYFKCWKWGKINDKRMRNTNPSPKEWAGYYSARKFLFFAIAGGLLGLVILIMPILWK